jgi:putative protease
MATRTKAKGKAKGKRKKAPVRKAAKKTARKVRTIRKKVAKRAPLRPASPKKAEPTAKTAGKPTPISERAPTVRPSSRHAAQPVPVEQRIGVVTHYYGHLSVVAMQLEPGAMLRVGDIIHIRGHTTDFTQKVESLEVNHAPVAEVAPNDDFGLKVVEQAREHDVVFKVRS